MVLALAVMAPGPLSAAKDNAGWNEYKTKHFLIYYQNVSQDFVTTVEEQAEEYFTEITDNLGFRRMGTWSFDDRAKIYIYNNQQEYITGAKQLNWSHGVANIRKKTIITFPAAAGFFDATLPHELGHIIFREFVGFKSSIPLWLDEGVAMFQEKAKRWGANQEVQKAIREGKFIPLRQLTNTRLSNQTPQEVISLFYNESASVVYFMITEMGRFRFLNFCQNLQRGHSLESALKLTYIRFSNIDDLNKAWLKYLQE